MLFNRKKILFIFWIFLSLFANTTDAKDSRDHVNIKGYYLLKAKSIEDFQLTTHANNNLTRDHLKNHWTLMFFGFTNCPMICPKTLLALNGMYQLLQTKLAKDQLPNVVFVSIDPERDTVSRLKHYITYFNPAFIGARANLTETKKLMSQLNIVVAKMQLSGSDKNRYTLDHSAEILVFNPEAKLQALLNFPHEPHSLAHDYQAILKAYHHAQSS